MGGGAPERDLSVGDAANLWGVSRGTVYYWVRTGTLTCFHPGPSGEAVATLDDVVSAQVLSRREVLARGVPPGRLERAIREGVVRPIHGRFSMRDMDALVERSKQTAATSTPAGGHRPSGFTRKAFEWTEQDELSWVERGADPSELPDAYFDLPTPPRFIPPPNVWRYAFDAPVPGRPGSRYIRRSAGYERNGGRLVWCEENDRFDVRGKNDPMPQAWIDSGRAHRLAEERWVRAWWSRQRPRSRGEE
jgi:hypothetical protein